jgi:hypothetical protein
MCCKFEEQVKHHFIDWQSDTYLPISRDVISKMDDVEQDRLKNIFSRSLQDFKHTQLASARKSFSNANSKPNSIVAALIEDENKKRLIGTLVPSKGTLLVVPAVLLEHWKVSVVAMFMSRYDLHSLIFSLFDGVRCK